MTTAIGVAVLGVSTLVPLYTARVVLALILGWLCNSQNTSHNLQSGKEEERS